MKKPTSIIIIVALVSIFLGWTIGNFFTTTTLSKAIAQIPASPIILSAEYNKKEHSITYSILNSGGTEVKIVQQSFIFKPGKESNEKGYIVSNIPVNIKLNPGVITKLEMKLKKGTEKLHIGDIVLSTFSYVHPLSTDIYTIAHSFELGTSNKENSNSKNKEVSK